MEKDASPPRESPSSAENRDTKRLLLGVGFCLFIVTASFNYFLFREIVPLRTQLDNLSEFTGNHVSNAVPMMRSFLGQLQNFARANPDFRPILGKYIPLTNAVSVPLPVAAPSAPVGAAPPPERGR